jgi:ribosomal protein S12 methylthiotransferase accessory factor
MTKKLKDDIPLNTINKIRAIINDLGILVTEKWFESGLKNMYSVRIEVINTEVGTNGKGITKEYALASAYGEFIERLQNDVLFSTQYSEKQNFIFCPDEQYFSIENLLNNSNGLIGNILKDYLPVKTKRKNKFFSNLLRLNNYNSNGKFLCQPYCNLKSGKLQFFPKSFQMAVGTNGMCSGNSPFEAIVQGICEILERYVQRKIIKEEICPPEIPDSYIEKYFPEFYKNILEIKIRGNYYISIRDCSLGHNYPVIALILIDRKSQNYIVNFGSHIDLSIALERAITEAFQGRNLDLINNHYCYGDKPITVSDNIANLLKSASGIYPDNFFSNNYSYKFDNLEYIEYSCNIESLKNLKIIIYNNNFDIFVRDCSFAGFTSYHVFIPGMSEVFGFDLFDIESRLTLIEIRKILEMYPHVSQDEFEMALLYINYNRKLNHLNKGLKYYLPQNKNTYIEKDVNQELIFVIWGMVVLKDWYNVEKLCNALIKNMNHDIKSIEYCILCDYAKAKIHNKTDIYIFSILEKFYVKDTVNQMKIILKNSKTFFKNFCLINQEKNHSIRKELIISIKNKIFQTKNRYSYDQSRLFKLLETN